jgi:hypothetical protein
MNRQIVQFIVALVTGLKVGLLSRTCRFAWIEDATRDLAPYASRKF